MILDSNIIIYAAQPDHPFLRALIAEQEVFISQLSYLEVLGYHRLSEIEKQYFLEFFEQFDLLEISPSIILQATQLRQQKAMSVGDAIIAATALIYDFALVTRNIKDFAWIANLSIINPFEDKPF
jgi:predicted nucleic acid-binding protein